MSSTIMAAQPTSTKPAVLPAKSADSKHNKMHRRSRTGCFTCRLRRKKCDEGKPGCKACRKLTICCEYKRPMWWGNAEQRRAHKEMIKNQIKNMKIAEKQAASQHIPLPANTPPSLYHSPSDGMARTRGGSMDSTYSDQFDFNATTTDIFTPQIVQTTQAPTAAPFGFQPFNDYVKVDTEWTLNDINVRRDSTITTSFFEQLPPSEDQPFMDNWVQKSSFEHQQQLLTTDQIDFSIFDFSVQAPMPAPVTLPSQSPLPAYTFKVEERDQYLLQHFEDVMTPMVFPMLRLNVSEKVQHEFSHGPLERNLAYYHAALSYAALHLKVTQGSCPQLLEDLSRHVSETISLLAQWLADPTKYTQVAEATLAMIYLRGLVGELDQDECELPWDAHLKAAKDALERVNHAEVPNSVTIASWIDILGATMTGTKPAYADSYRNNMVSNALSGLSQFIGCDDRVLYLISEIACLESFKRSNTIDDIAVCIHIKSLGDHISNHETTYNMPIGNCFAPTGVLDGAQLSANLTHVFRIAARIYLCSLLPDFDASQPNIQSLVQSLTDALAFVPAGPEGFDRALVWPLLMAGAVSKPGSEFRRELSRRSVQMQSVAHCGSFFRMTSLLEAAWKINDEKASRGEQSVHWRDVMAQNNWNFLLI